MVVGSRILIRVPQTSVFEHLLRCESYQTRTPQVGMFWQDSATAPTCFSTSICWPCLHTLRKHKTNVVWTQNRLETCLNLSKKRYSSISRMPKSQIWGGQDLSYFWKFIFRDAIIFSLKSLSKPSEFWVCKKFELISMSQKLRGTPRSSLPPLRYDLSVTVFICWSM